ncbi:hypothetical protein DFH09DRAFT_1235953 [Mycena vulgaris]|nr:hypothetical protein DFH09DRAFT_1235953 [Mycena vulgaris]
MLRNIFLALSVAPFLETRNAASLVVGRARGYQFKWPVNKVAIIGAGVSGLIAYREFTGAGFAHVRVFERDDVPGGNWHYTEETPVDPPIPNVDPSVGDFVPSLPPPGSSFPVEKHYSDGDAQWREHRGPKPVWESLESNAPAITELPWPPGTPWHLPHRTLARYLRAFASFHGANSNDENPNIAYRTRVELHGWTLTLKRLEKTGPRTSKATWWTEDFDAIVVATGRYNAPNIPRISGLEDWAQGISSKYHSLSSIPPPTAIRKRDGFSRWSGGQSARTNISIELTVSLDQTSGVEISREINLHARKIYQSVRPPNPHLPNEVSRLLLRRLPANVSIVPEIRRFHAANSSFLLNVTRVIFATGFRYSFPFLPQFHNSSSSSRHPIVTDGTHLRSLHNDFCTLRNRRSVNWGLQSFTYSEYLSLALAKVWSRTARGIKDRGGYGRHLQFLGAERTAANIRFYVGWLNDAAVKFGGKQIDGESKDLPQISAVWTQAQFSGFDPRPDLNINETVNSLDWVYGEDW